MRGTLTAILVATTTVMAACAAEPSDTTTTGATSPSAATATTTTTTTTTTTVPLPGDPVAAAVEDLVDRLEVDAGQVSVVTHEDVVWSDGSLGCPEPGVVYTQATVPGYRIVLAAGDAEYHYHGSQGDEPFLCHRPTVESGYFPSG